MPVSFEGIQQIQLWGSKRDGYRAEGRFFLNAKKALTYVSLMGSSNFKSRYLYSEARKDDWVVQVGR